MKSALFVGGSVLLATGVSQAVTVTGKTPPAWSVHSTEPSKSHIELTFAVSLSNSERLEQTLLRVSSPSSADYGKLLTLQQVEEMTRPSSDALSAVSGFLAEHGAKDIQYSSGFLRAVLPISVAEKMLSTKYSSFIHGPTGRVAVRCANYSLPADIAEHVDFVAPTIGFPQAMQVQPIQSGAAQAYQNTPDSLRDLYGLGDAMGGVSGARQGESERCPCRPETNSSRRRDRILASVLYGGRLAVVLLSIFSGAERSSYCRFVASDLRLALPTESCDTIQIIRRGDRTQRGAGGS